MRFLKKETIFQDVAKLKGVGSVLSKYLKKKRIETTLKRIETIDKKEDK